MIVEVKPSTAPATLANSEFDALAAQPPSAEFLRLIPHEFARRHLILSRGRAENVERLLTSHRTSPAAVWNTRTHLGVADVDCTEAPADLLAAAIDRAYLIASPPTDVARIEIAPHADPAGDLDSLLNDADLLTTHGKAPIIRLVDLLIFQALQLRASDVHIQPLNDRVLVRFRLDGVLHTVREVPAPIAPAVISRVKVMAKLDVAEQRAPQDGRTTVTLGDAQHGARRVDLRISTIPTTYGERVVIRLLDSANSPRDLTFASLGMPADIADAFRREVSRDSGIVLVTGPTGSGKSTTLYTTLAWITQTTSAPVRGCEFNIMTIEDPVEYDLSTASLAISQTQVNPKRGVTFAAGLRHILRQDPDVIMVGEIRDEETARIAVQASLTGHLVLSTLHTNSAPSAVTRLLDLAIEPFLVSSSLAAVLAQRLVRTLHSACAGRGCDACMSTGFRGRSGIFELLLFDDALRELIASRANAAALASAAIAKGMRTLAQSGADLVTQAVTTEREVERAISGVTELTA